MVAFEFDKAVRWARIDRPISLRRRKNSELPFLSSASSGQALLLDTCVYIDQIQDKLPASVDKLFELRLSNHSTIALAEMMHSVGRLDPLDPRTPDAIEIIGRAIKLMHTHRLFEPDADILGRAAILGGILSRVQGYQKDDRLRVINDCVLFLQAAKLGLTVLSRNIGDFDFLLQLFPTGRVLFYTH